jgi:hypothetical protein
MYPDILAELSTAVCAYSQNLHQSQEFYALPSASSSGATGMGARRVGFGESAQSLLHVWVFAVARDHRSTAHVGTGPTKPPLQLIFKLCPGRHPLSDDIAGPPRAALRAFNACVPV